MWRIGNGVATRAPSLIEWWTKVRNRVRARDKEKMDDKKDNLPHHPCTFVYHFPSTTGAPPPIIQVPLNRWAHATPLWFRGFNNPLLVVRMFALHKKRNPLIFHLAIPVVPSRLCRRFGLCQVPLYVANSMEDFSSSSRSSVGCKNDQSHKDYSHSEWASLYIDLCCPIPRIYRWVENWLLLLLLHECISCIWDRPMRRKILKIYSCFSYYAFSYCI